MKSRAVGVEKKNWNSSLPCLKVNREKFSRVNSVSFSYISLMQSERFRLFILDRQPLIKRPCIIKEISHTENMSDAQCSVSGIEMPVIGNVADCFWNKIGMKG